MTSAVACTPSASYVKLFVLGTTSEIVEKSPGPAVPISNVMIGMDSFVALSITKANAENVYQSSGA